MHSALDIRQLADISHHLGELVHLLRAITHESEDLVNESGVDIDAALSCLLPQFAHQQERLAGLLYSQLAQESEPETPLRAVATN